jgi:hypothetical protein
VTTGGGTGATTGDGGGDARPPNTGGVTCVLAARGPRAGSWLVALGAAITWIAAVLRLAPGRTGRER